jgi:hypothetical protein
MHVHTLGKPSDKFNLNSIRLFVGINSAGMSRQLTGYGGKGKPVTLCLTTVGIANERAK